MNVRRIASGILLAAAVTVLAGAAERTWSLGGGFVYCEIVKAIEPSLALGSPF